MEPVFVKGSLRSWELPVPSEADHVLQDTLTLYRRLGGEASERVTYSEIRPLPERVW
jgi:hypothetical protein